MSAGKGSVLDLVLVAVRQLTPNTVANKGSSCEKQGSETRS